MADKDLKNKVKDLEKKANDLEKKLGETLRVSKSTDEKLESLQKDLDRLIELGQKMAEAKGKSQKVD